ncbi:hypothetical protein Tco_0664846 [Tanacetum coccineum]
MHKEAKNQLITNHHATTQPPGTPPPQPVPLPPTTIFPLTNLQQYCGSATTIVQFKEYEDLSTKSSQGSAFLSEAFHNLCHLKRLQRLGMFVLVLLYPIKLSRAEVAPSAQNMAPGKTA